MEKEEILREIEAIVDKKIQEHEVRVGWISGIIGLFFVFGIVHSIWLMKHWVSTDGRPNTSIAYFAGDTSPLGPSGHVRTFGKVRI